MSETTEIRLKISKRGMYITQVVEEDWGNDYLDVSLELYDATIAALQARRAEHVANCKRNGIVQSEPLPEWVEVYQDGGSE